MAVVSGGGEGGAPRWGGRTLARAPEPSLGAHSSPPPPRPHMRPACRWATTLPTATRCWMCWGGGPLGRCCAAWTTHRGRGTRRVMGPERGAPRVPELPACQPACLPALPQHRPPHMPLLHTIAHTASHTRTPTGGSEDHPLQAPLPAPGCHRGTHPGCAARQGERWCVGWGVLPTQYMYLWGGQTERVVHACCVGDGRQQRAPGTRPVRALCLLAPPVPTAPTLLPACLGGGWSQDPDDAVNIVRCHESFHFRCVHPEGWEGGGGGCGPFSPA